MIKFCTLKVFLPSHFHFINVIKLPLSLFVQPDREDELLRIEGGGGKVINWNGARVFGVLAMSRAIGTLIYLHVQTYSLRHQVPFNINLANNLSAEIIKDVNGYNRLVIRVCSQTDLDCVNPVILIITYPI